MLVLLAQMVYRQVIWLSKTVTTVSYSHSLSCPRFCFLGIWGLLLLVWCVNKCVCSSQCYKQQQRVSVSRCGSNKILQEHVYKEKQKKSVRIIYVICNPGRGVGVFWSLFHRFTEYRKVRGRESLKLTEGGLGLHPQIRRDLGRDRLLAAHRPGV